MLSSPIFSAALRGVQRFIDIALLEQPLLGREVAPDAGEAVCLQFHPHGHLIGFHFAHRLPHLVELGQHANEILDMVADFMSDDIGLREVAGRAELPVKLREEGGVEIDLLVTRAIERPGRC